MTTLYYLEKIDETLAHWEDYFHGQEGADVTEARFNLNKIRQQLLIHGVVKSLNVEKTNPNFDEWLQTHEKFKDNTYVWGMGYIMSYSDMKEKHKELLQLNI
jgi:hypothetical protein